MRTWLTFWKRTEALDVDRELHAARPVPREQFVKSLAAWMSPKPVSPVRTRSRIAIAGVATAVMVAAVGATGGFSAAASSVATAARATSHAVQDIVVPPQVPATPHTAPSPPSSAAAQYLGVPTITKVTPTSGKAGTAVTVTGTNLGGITHVTIAGIIVTSFSNLTTSSVTFQVPASGASAVGPVTVTNPAGTVPSSQNFTFIVAPNITGLSVALGHSLTALEPGDTVTITGTGFRGVDIAPGSVTMDGTPVKTFSVSGDTSISATVPSAISKTASGPVVVKNAAGTSSSAPTLVKGAAGPTISGLGATSGIGGTTLQINGQNFNEGVDVVKINGVTATHVNVGSTSWTATKAFVTIPGSPAIGPSGFAVGPVTITDGAGVSTGPNFTTIVTPSVSGISPTSAAPGAVVTITGNHFTGTSSVTFFHSPHPVIASFTLVSDTTIRAVVPKTAAGGVITVTNKAGSGTSPAFSLAPAPTITNVTQDATPAVPGTTIHLIGSGFDTVGTVTITFTGGVSATATVADAGHLTVSLLAGAKTGPVSLSESAGSVKSTKSVTVAPAPTISSFPASQAANGTKTITIAGKGFKGTDTGASTTVALTGCAAAAPNAGFTDTSMTVTVQACANFGPITVTTNAGTTTSSKSFTPIKAPLPTGLWPNNAVDGHGAQKVGGKLTISGSQLSGSALVTFTGGKTAVPAVLSDGNITVVVPAGAASGTITVTTKAGTTVVGTGTITGFELLQAPTINTVGGLSVTLTTLTINGTNFVNTDDLSVTVKIGTAACTSVNVVSSTQVTCTIPGSVVHKKLAVTVSEEAGTVASKPFQF